MCGMKISQVMWIRKLLRWMGFKLEPDFTIEDMVIDCSLGLIAFDPNNYEEFHIDSEDAYYYYLALSLSRPYGDRIERAKVHMDNTTNVRFRSKKNKTCVTIDAEVDFAERVRKSKEKCYKQTKKPLGVDTGWKTDG
jgi:hypothetical protein